MPVDLSSDFGRTTRRRATDPDSYVAGDYRTQGAEDGTLELVTAVERLHAAGEHQHRAAFRDLVEGLKQAQEAGRLEELAAALRSALTPTLDYTSAQSLNRFHKALPASLRGRSRLKLAILGGFTTHQLRILIELYLFATGISAVIYEADYGVFRQEILDPSSDLYHFEPGVIFLATHWRNIGHLPALTDPAEKVGSCLRRNTGNGRCCGRRRISGSDHRSCRTILTRRLGDRWAIMKCGIRPRRDDSSPRSTACWPSARRRT